MPWKKPNKSSLHIRGYKLHVHLGWPENEREGKQMVMLDIYIQFENPPLACTSDDLKDTICYSMLVSHIQEHLENKKFHLIEYLGHEIYHFVKTHLQLKNTVHITVTKQPHITGLTGGVTFNYGDPKATW